MPLYRVKPGQTVNHNSVMVTEHDEPIEVPLHVAIELRGLLDPVDEDGKLPEGPVSSVLQGPRMDPNMRLHERRSVLQAQEQQLHGQLKFVQAQIADIEDQFKQQQVAQEKRQAPPAARPRNEKPAQEA